MTGTVFLCSPELIKSPSSLSVQRWNVPASSIFFFIFYFLERRPNRRRRCWRLFFFCFVFLKKIITSNFFMSAHSKLRVCVSMCVPTRRWSQAHIQPLSHILLSFTTWLWFLSPCDDPSTLTEFQIHTNTSSVYFTRLLKLLLWATR